MVRIHNWISRQTNDWPDEAIYRSIEAKLGALGIEDDMEFPKVGEGPCQHEL